MSATLHLIFGHQPELFRLLEAGNSRRAQIAETIRVFRKLQAVPIVHKPRTPLASFLVDSVVDRIKEKLIPEIVTHGNRALAQAHASMIEVFLPERQFPTASPLPQTARRMTHPYLLQRLREFMGQAGTELGFTNVHQAQVTQLMFEGRRHIGYISATGELEHLLA